MNIQTCTDFTHLNVKCCDVCHTLYPYYDMDLVDLEDGGKAWVCCAVWSTLVPKRYNPAERSPMDNLLNVMFGADNQDE